MIYPGLTDVQPRYHNQDYFLRLLESRLPREYVAALKAGDADGYCILQVIAAVAARVSLAIGRVERDALLPSSGAGSRSAGTVLIWRSNTAGNVTVKAGTTFLSSRTGRRYLLRSDIYLSGGMLSTWTGAYIDAEAPGYEWDCTTDYYGAGEYVSGPIDVIEVLKTDPVTDPSIWAFVQLDQVEGGRAPSRNMHGADLGAPAQAASTDGYAYFQQVVGMEDTVSAPSIYRGLLPLLAPYGYAPIVREGGGRSLPGLFLDAGDSTDTDPDLCFALDMDDTDGWKVLLSYEESRGFILVELPAGLSDSLYAACWDTAFAKHAAGVVIDMIRT